MLEVILSLLLLVSLFVNLNIYKKYSKLEELYDELDSIATENQEFIFAIRNRVLSQRSYLKQLDKIGSFEADDEVGIFFKELKKIINDISAYLDVEQNENGGEVQRSASVLGSIRKNDGE